VADAFDAMTRGHAGRPPRAGEDSLAELEAHAGSQFDPALVRAFVDAYQEHGPL